MRPRHTLHGLAAASMAVLLAAVAFVGTSVTPASAGTTGELSFYAGNGTDGAPTPGAATESTLNYPSGLAVDAAGNLYIADTYNSLVEKVTPDGTLSIFAGTGTGGSVTPGPATDSNIEMPWGIAVDSSGSVYIADAANHVVLKVTSDGTLSIIAGTGNSGTVTPGPATSSDLGEPRGLAVDPSGNVFIADAANLEVLKVTPEGTLSIIAGTGDYGVATPGPATSASFYEPTAVALDASGNLYIVDNSHLVVKVTPGGTLSYVTGDGNSDLPTPGPATSSRVTSPEGIAVDPSGNVYIADTGNSVVTKVDTNGNLSYFAGTTVSAAPTPGPAVDSALWYPYAITFDSVGNAYIADYSRVVKVAGSASGSAPDQIIEMSDTKGDTQATLRFTTPNNNGSAITSYEAKINNGSWTTVPCTAGTGTNTGTTSCTITGLTNYTDVAISMRAVNARGAGTASSTIVTRPRLTGPNLTKASANNSTGIHVAFTGVTILGTTAKGYTAYAYEPGTGTYVASCVAKPRERACDIKGLTPGTRYDIRVVHYFSFNTSRTIPRETLASNTRSVTTRR